MAVSEKTKDIKKDASYLRDKEKEMVRGVFKFYEVQGGSMSFVFKKHKGDQIEKYEMVDGGVYTVPLAVAKHLNNDCWYPVHKYTMDENGKPSQRVSEKVQRCGFQSLEFTDMDDFDSGPSRLVSVTNL